MIITIFLFFLLSWNKFRFTEKSPRQHRGSPETLHPILPNCVKILCNYSTFVKTWKVEVVILFTKIYTCLSFLQFFY